MKNSEEAIERMLAGLRDADAPAGMERRILEALDDRAATRTRSGWSWLRPMWRVAPARPFAVGSVGSLVCGVALVSLFVAALAIPSIRRFGLAPARSKMNPAGAEAAAESVSLTAATAANRTQLHPTESDGQPMRRTSEAEMTDATTGRVDHTRDRDGRDREGRDGVADGDTDSDSVALEEMRAASHPAPPLPLTEQERLLLRIAHRGDPVELAMLDPTMRAARDVEEGAEFQRFFGSATVRQPSTEQPSTQQPATEQPKTEQPKSEQPAMDQPTTEQSRTGDKE
jgi:hypothetical protein